MKAIRFHSAVVRSIGGLDAATRLQLADLLTLLAAGESLEMPISRPMPSIRSGVHELRLRDRAGHLRVFYFTKHKEAILVFHLFRKKTRRTPKREIDTAIKRLEEMQ